MGQARVPVATSQPPPPGAGILRDLRQDRWQVALLSLVSTVHALLFAFDWHIGFRQLLAGDRSSMRFDALLSLLHARDHGLATMVAAPVVPGEYLLHLPAYVLCGPAGIVIVQVLLGLLATVALYRLARCHAGSQRVAFAIVLAFALSPQVLVFQHQFVTEAVAGSLAILFVCGLEASFGSGGRRALLAGAVCLGLAILVRPSLALVLPLISVAAIWGGWLPLRIMAGRLLLLWGVAAAPIAVWVALFTVTTGHAGYTSGVASLGWNLRSRVFLVESRRDLPLAPEVQRFPTYESLYHDTGGISVFRFLTIVQAHPGPFLASMAVDQGIVFGRANTTKLTVDYLGLGDRERMKNWRDVFDRSGTRGMIGWAMRDPVTQFVVAIEAVASLAYLLASGVLAAFLLVCAVRPRAIVRWLDSGERRRLQTGICFVVMVAVSANMVDRAQAKLRLPGDVGLVLVLLTVGMVVRRRWQGLSSIEAGTGHR